MTRRQGTDPLDQTEVTKQAASLTTSEQERGMTALIGLVLNALEMHGGRRGSVQQIVSSTRQALGIPTPTTNESNDAATAKASPVHNQNGPPDRPSVPAQADLPDDAGRDADSNGPPAPPQSNARS
jgi:hypothetical protein